MKTLHKTEWIAVAVAMGLLTYLLFSDPLLNLFNSMNNQANASSAQGVSVRDVTVGSGTQASAGDTITAHYVGRLTDGRVFDSSVDRGVPISFILGVGQVIRVGMKVSRG